MYRSVIMLPQIVWIQFLQLCHNFWRWSHLPAISLRACWNLPEWSSKQWRLLCSLRMVFLSAIYWCVFSSPKFWFCSLDPEQIWFLFHPVVMCWCPPLCMFLCPFYYWLFFLLLRSWDQLFWVHALAHTVNVHYSIYCQTVKHYGIGSVQIKVSIFNGLAGVVYQNCSGSHHSTVYPGAMVVQHGLSYAHGWADLGGLSIFWTVRSGIPEEYCAKKFGDGRCRQA